ncbi:interleukin 17a/f2 [Pimephales promelas]|uniref:interleukin 17a/f2 n=1 Tax=Pimephales promelas TaxID=90988 RepID=UPI0019557D42|nr:interleukin 17a/f2 [Pimephales promelas]KAG1973142.1 interleukin-17A [Pimephales promelas]
MFLNFLNAKYMVLLCALASLTFAKQKPKQVCDTDLTISDDFYGSPSEDMVGNGNIHNNSLSAWTWIPKISHNRIPQVIFEAQCKSEYCTFPTGVDERLNSVPIYQDIMVLKKDSKDKKCFRATFERVIVGCTCVWAKTS